MKRFRIPKLALFVAIYFFFILNLPAIAGLVPSISSSETNIKYNPIELEKIKSTLEMKIVAEKLSAYGLTPEEVKSKLSEMTSEQIHLLAQASDKILAGGDGIGLIIGVLIIVLLVIVILKLLNKTIVVK